jgi:hypothetical protein
VFLDYLIAVVVFVALSPLISMLPNGRKLKQAKMRQSALSLGMLVAFSDIPKASKYDKTEKGICYRLLTHDRKRAIVAGVHKFVRSSDTWVSAGPVSELQISLLNRLPKAVSAASIEPTACSIYWQEQGQEKDVISIFEVLTELIELKY